MKTDLNQTCNGIAQSVHTALRASQKMALAWERSHRLEREAERDPLVNTPMGGDTRQALHNGSLEVEFLCHVLLAELPRTWTYLTGERGGTF